NSRANEVTFRFGFGECIIESDKSYRSTIEQISADCTVERGFEVGVYCFVSEFERRHPALNIGKVSKPTTISLDFPDQTYDSRICPREKHIVTRGKPAGDINQHRAVLKILPPHDLLSL